MNQRTDVNNVSFEKKLDIPTTYEESRFDAVEHFHL